MKNEQQSRTSNYCVMGPLCCDAVDTINKLIFISSLHIQRTATLKDTCIHDDKDCTQHSAELQQVQTLDDILTESYLLEHDRSLLFLRSTTKTLTTTIMATATDHSTGEPHRDLSGGGLFMTAGLTVS